MSPKYLAVYFPAIANALKRELSQKTEQLGLTATQGMFIHRIWFCTEKMNTPVYAKDLEEFFHIKHPTVSGILQRLEASGYLLFEADSGDRRCKSIHLTEKAMETHAELEALILQMNDQLVQGMSREQIESFRRLLDTAAENTGICFPENLKNREAKEHE